MSLGEAPRLGLAALLVGGPNPLLVGSRLAVALGVVWQPAQLNRREKLARIEAPAGSPKRRALAKAICERRHLLELLGAAMLDQVRECLALLAVRLALGPPAEERVGEQTTERGQRPPLGLRGLCLALEEELDRRSRRIAEALGDAEALATEVVAKRGWVMQQALALFVLAPASLLPERVLLVVGAAGRAEGGDEIERSSIGCGMPNRLEHRAPRLAGKPAGAGEERGVVLELIRDDVEERRRTRLGDRCEQERWAEVVLLPPGAGVRVVGVTARLRPQPTVRHRPQVDLEQPDEAAPVIVFELDSAVGGDRPPLPIACSERLTRVALAREKRQHNAAGRERDVEAGQRRRMREEGRVRL